MTTVLVVDDEPIVRDVVSRYLRRDGHAILEADDADEARSLIEREDLGLVVLDIMLPGTSDVNGLSPCGCAVGGCAFRFVRFDTPTTQVPRACATGIDSPLQEGALMSRHVSEPATALSPVRD